MRFPLLAITTFFFFLELYVLTPNKIYLYCKCKLASMYISGVIFPNDSFVVS